MIKWKKYFSFFMYHGPVFGYLRILYYLDSPLTFLHLTQIRNLCNYMDLGIENEGFTYQLLALNGWFYQLLVAIKIPKKIVHS